MSYAAQTSIFEVFADETMFGVLEACWHSRSGDRPDLDELERTLGPRTKSAIGRLVDLELVDDRWGRCRLRSHHLWSIAQAARELPCGRDLFVRVLTVPRRRTVVERLRAGPVKRARLNALGATADISKDLDLMRLLKLIDSEKNAKTVRLADRPQVAWIFLLVDQFLMDVHMNAAKRYRAARTAHRAALRPREDERPRDYILAEATPPSGSDEFDDPVDLPPGAYESAVDSCLARWPDEIRSVELVGRYPSTRVHAQVGLDGPAREVDIALWSAQFGLDATARRFPPPRLTANAVDRWVSSRALDGPVQTLGYPLDE